MGAQRWFVLLICAAVLIYSVIAGIQGSAPLWATAAAMVLVIGSILWSARKERSRQGPPPKSSAP